MRLNYCFCHSIDGVGSILSVQYYVFVVFGPELGYGLGGDFQGSENALDFLPR